MARIARLLFIIVWASSAALAQSASIAEQRTTRYFESIRRRPSLQLAFLREMPKGGDLHNHLSRAAVQTYDFLGYKDLRRMARMSLEHSFLPGSSLWLDDFRPAAACANDPAGAQKISAACRRFLDANERAQTSRSAIRCIRKEVLKQF